MNIRPLGSRIILEPIVSPKKVGSIHLPEETREKMKHRHVGTVIAIGPRVNALMAEKGEEPLHVGQVVVWDPNGTFATQGRNLKQRIVCYLDCIAGVVLDDPLATEEEYKAEKERLATIEKEQFEDAKRRMGGGVVQAPPGLKLS